MKSLAEKAASLISAPGVYLFRDSQGVVLYIGKSVNVHDRVKQHLSSSFEKARAIVNSSQSVEAISVASELEALLLEAQLIKRHLPRYNSASKDDKHPLYIKITREDYPKVTTSRKGEGLSVNNRSDIYFGPFPSSWAVRSVLKQIRRIFPFHSHSKIGKRPCFYFHLGFCQPCPSYIEQLHDKSKSRLRKEYLRNIQRIKMLLSGRSKSLHKTLEKEMKNAARSQNFESAARIRDKIKHLAYITAHYKNPKEYLENPNLLEDIREHETKDLYKLLKPHFKYLKYPKRLECYDVAHLAGKNAASSMVTFVSGEPDKTFYRHFRIRAESSQDDYLMLKETLTRRFKHFTDWGKPDLIIIDGGKGQVGSARVILKEYALRIPTIGLAKRLEEIVVPRLRLGSREKQDKLNLNYTIFRLPTGSPALSLLQRIRDEAHRFARSYHFRLRLKEVVNKNTFG